jgi:flagellar protein FliO/FliZ
MAHRVTSPAHPARVAFERLVERAFEPLPAALRSRPRLTGVALAGLITIVVRMVMSGSVGAAGGAGATAPAGNGSALALFGGSTDAQTGVAAGLPLGGAAGSLDVVDLLFKGLLVIALLFLTLRVLRRFQTGAVTAGARIRVLESRTLGPKATLHLVSVGDRQLVVGLTPGRLVTLAELPADDLDIEAGDELDLVREPVQPADRSMAALVRRIVGALR